MIQMETILNVADNSGARRVKCVKVLGGSKRRYAGLADVIIGAVQEATPGGSVKKGDIVRCVIVRTTKDTRDPLRRNDMPKMKIKKGDKVEVLTGKDKGKRGEVLRVYPEKNKVVVEGVAIAKRHVKPNAANQQGGIVEAEAAIDASNVALIDPKTDKPTRVGYLIKEDGTKVRVSKKSGAEL